MADAPMLYHCSTSADMWNHCTGAPVGQHSCAEDHATPPGHSYSHRGRLIYRRPRLIAPCRPPPPPDAPLALVQSPAIDRASRSHIRTTSIFSSQFNHTNMFSKFNG
uniref:Uncharacterized protein n=1 Tax=Oryza sativa subsp. japonica TaxID=39947 RepID=Q8H5L4_ORYSJ|nr:hypothetical protein [Oryza sativa Japonica Group]